MSPSKLLTVEWWPLHALFFEKAGFHCIHIYNTIYTVCTQAQIQQTLTRQALSSIHWHALGTE